MSSSSEIVYYRVDPEELVERLRRALEAMPDVKVAALFGSSLKRQCVRDVDVGISTGGACSLERIIEIAGALEDAVGIPVDVVPLEEAPPKLALKALTEGVRLVVRDSGLFTHLLVRAASEAMDVDLKLRYNRASPIALRAQMESRDEVQ